MITATSVEILGMRAALYDALAQLLADPSQLAGFPKASALAEIVKQGATGLGSPACRRALFALDDLPPISAEDLRRRFEEVLNPPGRRPLATYESLATHGRLVGPISQTVAMLYRQWGIDPDGDLPDAASVELAFAAFLLGEEAAALAESQGSRARTCRRTQRQFLREHLLAWLPQLGRGLRSAGAHCALVGQLLEEFLKEEQLRSVMPKGGNGKGDLPVAFAPDRCSLCGFCVQSCPTGALWVAETNADTTLLLNPARCIGCAKCLPVCPDHVLRMVPRSVADLLPSDPTPLLLVHSQRARCPRCGDPTVSQAELGAVFARLDASPDLRHRISLCNRCKSSGMAWVCESTTARTL